jgi:holliday junction DNA helicase RuvB
MAEAEVAAEAARLAAAGQSEEDRALDLSLRPRMLGEFVGQERTRKILGMSIEAARQRGEVLDHVLFSGPPGLGKTSLAHIIARERGVSMRSTSGPAIERAGDLAAIVSGLDEGDVLFIASRARSRKCCILRWRISNSTSWWARGWARARCRWR